MKIVLAGYNLDREVIDELKKGSLPRDDVTPETLSASYARISRDPRPADELRRIARAELERARRSNRTIIFKMGHHSVAEHAVFNFDIIGVSRLAIEEIERFRLCSFTEKSQRYITLGDDFVIPEEINKAGHKERFVRTVKAQNALYHSLYRKLKPHIFSKFKAAAKNPKNHSILDGWAKEDARYVVSLATEGQLGMTLNARNLELLIRRFASKNLAELRDLNSRIYALAKEVAPSIILFTEGSDFDGKTVEGISGELEKKGIAGRRGSKRTRSGARRVLGRRGGSRVELVDFTPSADDKLLAALMYATSSLPISECSNKIAKLPTEDKKDIFKRAFERMEFYDFPIREFEYVDLTYDLIVSASCYAQLKRHRMATLTSQRYDPALGVTIPPSIDAIRERRRFLDIIAQTEESYDLLKKDIDSAADYVLTNAHRRRILFKVNARELYHISRLREDATAQWEIRNLASRMSSLAETVAPLTCLMLGGKDAYPEIYKRVFGRLPAILPPKIMP